MCLASSCLSMGCATIFGYGKIDYAKGKTSPPLIPPDFETVQKIVEERNAARGLTSGIDPFLQKIRLERGTSQQWVVIDTPKSDIVGHLKAFISQQKMMLESEKNNEIATQWLNIEQSKTTSSEKILELRQKLIFKIEAGKVGKPKVKIEVIYLQEEKSEKSDKWEPVNQKNVYISSVSQAQEYSQKLLYWFRDSERTLAGAVSSEKIVLPSEGDSLVLPRLDPSEITHVRQKANGEVLADSNYLLLKESVSIVWRRLEQSLDKGNFVVFRRDKPLLQIEIEYFDPEIEVEIEKINKRKRLENEVIPTVTSRRFVLSLITVDGGSKISTDTSVGFEGLEKYSDKILTVLMGLL